MDDLFSYPEPIVHGGNGSIKPTRRRARTANSFRAVWEPVVAPDFGELPGRRIAAAACPRLVARRRCGARARAEAGVAVLDAPRPAPVIDFGEIAHPIADVATAVKRRAHVTTWDRLFTRGLEMLPFALRGAADLDAGVGCVLPADPARRHAAGLRHLLGVALAEHGHPHRARISRDEGDGAHRLAASSTSRRRCRTGRSPPTTGAPSGATSSRGTTSTT